MATTDPGLGMLILDSRGDVILKLGAEGECRLLVSSNALTLASPVFRAMFTGGFAESQDLSSASPREVPLPDDNEATTILFCRIIHHNHAKVPAVVDLELFAQLTVLCDKYQCAAAVRPWAMHWVTVLLPRIGEVGFEKLLLVTHGLDLPAQFTKVTELLVKDR
ncbi:uncharacterized protein BDZ99DRAFT_414378, partial [Mytilinidion resinicola]